MNSKQCNDTDNFEQYKSFNNYYIIYVNINKYVMNIIIYMYYVYVCISYILNYI